MFFFFKNFIKFWHNIIKMFWSLNTSDSQHFWLSFIFIVDISIFYSIFFKLFSFTLSRVFCNSFLLRIPAVGIVFQSWSSWSVLAHFEYWINKLITVVTSSVYLQIVYITLWDALLSRKKWIFRCIGSHFYISTLICGLYFCLVHHAGEI